MPSNLTVVDSGLFVGSKITEISFAEPCYWHFLLQNGTSIAVECLWRIANSEAIILTSEDHHQKFGLPQPIGARERAMHLLAQSNITEFLLRPETLDVVVGLSNGNRLEVIVTSSGYEGWKIVTAERKQIVAQGGGQLCSYSD